MKLSRALMKLRRVMRNDQIVLALLALLTGLGVGLLVIGLRQGIGVVQWIAFGNADEFLASHAAGLPWWRVLLAPALGGLLVGVFAHYLMPGRRPQGVADVMEAVALHRGRMSPLAGLGTAMASMITIGSGGSLGREGPAVHLGASFCAVIARLLRMPRQLARTLVGCGASAAVAASFNAPIAGALFANEVVLGHYAITAFAPIVIASVTATIVSRSFFGDFPAFSIPHGPINPLELPIFAGLGLLCGFVALGLIRGTGLFAEIGARLLKPAWLRPGLAGLLVGIIALAYPEVLGSGYEATVTALQGNSALTAILGLTFAKLLATCLSAGSGMAGGVFAPSLVIGATLGAAVGLGLDSVFPGLVSVGPAYAVVGMGALASASLGAPISTTLIIFELTGDYALTMAVMVASVLASTVVRQAGHSSFFGWQLRRRGIELFDSSRGAILKTIQIRHVMTRTVETVTADQSLRTIRLALLRSHAGHLFVVNARGALIGTISLADLDEAAFDPTMDDLVRAADVARLHPSVVTAEDTLDQARAMMQANQLEHLAVVKDRETMLLTGCLHEVDALEAENTALINLRREER